MGWQKKVHSTVCTWNAAPQPGGARQYLAVVGQPLFVWWLYRKARLVWMSKTESIVLDLYTSVFVWICWQMNSCLIFLMLMLRVFSTKGAKQSPAHCLCSRWSWGLESDMVLVLQVELIWPTGNWTQRWTAPQRAFFHLSHCKWTWIQWLYISCAGSVNLHPQSQQSSPLAVVLKQGISHIRGQRAVPRSWRQCLWGCRKVCYRPGHCSSSHPRMLHVSVLLTTVCAKRPSATTVVPREVYRTAWGHFEVLLTSRFAEWCLQLLPDHAKRCRGRHEKRQPLMNWSETEFLSNSKSGDWLNPKHANKSKQLMDA